MDDMGICSMKHVIGVAKQSYHILSKPCPTAEVRKNKPQPTFLGVDDTSMIRIEPLTSLKHQLCLFERIGNLQELMVKSSGDMQKIHQSPTFSNGKWLEDDLADISGSVKVIAHHRQNIWRIE